MEYPFKMKGSPAKLGTIEGTSGHASALKLKTKSPGTKKPIPPKTKEFTKEELKQMKLEEKIDDISNYITEGSIESQDLRRKKNCKGKWNDKTKSCE